MQEDGTEEEAEELRARLAASRAALERLDELAVEDWTREDTIERVRGMYEFRQRRFKVRAGKIEDEDGIEDRSLAYQRLMRELYIGAAAGPGRAAQRRPDQQRRDAPDRARARPRGNTPRCLTGPCTLLAGVR